MVRSRVQLPDSTDSDLGPSICDQGGFSTADIHGLRIQAIVSVSDRHVGEQLTPGSNLVGVEEDMTISSNEYRLPTV